MLRLHYLEYVLKNQLQKKLHKHQPIHFIGIGGIGMSALALVLAKRGYCISGSDQSKKLDELVKAKIKIFSTQSASNIKSICQENKKQPLIVISSAIPKSNEELQAAKRANLEILHRSDILAELINSQPSIAIAGSHGKTTTSTIITTLLAIAGEDPTAVIGGIMPYFNSNAHVGKGKLLIAEADESDGTLVKFNPELGVVTNLELDHTDHYSDIESLIRTIKVFTNQCNKTIANFDCKVLRENFQPSAWCSINQIEGIDYAAIPLKIDGDKTIAKIYEKGELVSEIILPIGGKHNLSNALAAIAACRMEGISFKLIEKGLHKITTPERRFQLKGVWKGRQIFDDYAHHPNEINTTLETAQILRSQVNSNPEKDLKRVIAVFQAHRYSRTKAFLYDFAKALGTADAVFLPPIYEAGEKPLENISHHSLANAIRTQYPNLPVFTAESLKETASLLKTKTIKNDLILLMGAGDVNTIWKMLKEENREEKWETVSIAA